MFHGSESRNRGSNRTSTKKPGLQVGACTDAREYVSETR
jgi:hypothetical protein